ncbi:MAG: hypothetical protein R3D84_14560 [Paracoccaceae bacterium]
MRPATSAIARLLTRLGARHRTGAGDTSGRAGNPVAGDQFRRRCSLCADPAACARRLARKGGRVAGPRDLCANARDAETIRDEVHTAPRGHGRAYGPPISAALISRIASGAARQGSPAGPV